jgi:hypothetical protein
VSKQDYGTPRDFIVAVEHKLNGTIVHDLAAHSENRVVQTWFGPGSVIPDAFEFEWHKMFGLLWLNPPYEDIGKWAERCAMESLRGAHIAMLVPAAVGTNYFRKWIWPYARVMALSPRIAFLGQEPNPKTGKIDPYKKDLMLCEYSQDLKPSFECWRWK